MRYSLAIAAIAATVAAVPQAVYPISQIGDGQVQAPSVLPSSSAPVAPISQISDGQIQAPPATPAPVPSTPAYSAAPVPTPTATPIAPSPTLVTPIVPGVNSTIPSSTGGVLPPASPTASVPVQATGAASANMVSFGGMVLALGAAYLA